MTNKIAVYGSLLSELPNHHVIRSRPMVTAPGNGIAPGQWSIRPTAGFAMLDLGAFPGIVPVTSAATRRVYGPDDGTEIVRAIARHRDAAPMPSWIDCEIYTVDPITQRSLDSLEGYNADQPSAGFYLRTPVTLWAGANKIEAEVYALTARFVLARLNNGSRCHWVRSGDWRSYYKGA